jgi:hypothetical protein
MDLADLLRRVRATRSPVEPLHSTAATVWFALTDQLDSVDHAALGEIGVDALQLAGTVPEQVRTVISSPAVDAARAGKADWRRLSPADQEAFALLGFLTVVAGATAADDRAAPTAPLN